MTQPLSATPEGRAKVIEAVDAATPGPWHMLHDADDSPNKVCDCAQVWSRASDWCVAMCDTQEMGEGFTREKQMQNARLVSLAPELKPAMERIERYERVVKLVDSITLYDPATGIIDADALARIQLEATLALA